MLLCLSTWYLFGGDPHWLTASITSNGGGAMKFAFAYLPVILTLIISIVWRGLGGSVALLALGGIVIHYTDQQMGPFFLPGLHQGEPLLLAQCYLSTTALLVVFMRVLTQSARRYDPETGRIPGEGVMYQLRPQSGQILWDHNLTELLGVEATTLGTGACIRGTVTSSSFTGRYRRRPSGCHH